MGDDVEEFVGTVAEHDLVHVHFAEVRDFVGKIVAAAIRVEVQRWSAARTAASPLGLGP